MSIPMTSLSNQLEDGTTQASSVHSNRNQKWYQNLCRTGNKLLTQDEQKQVFPSPQRLQLQLHFQREYQQRQELQKNCRQEWWQRKSGSTSASPSPLGYRTPSPAHKFYAGAPVFYQDLSHHHPTPAPLRVRPPQPSTKNYYQPAADGLQGVSSGNVRRMEPELADGEREKMIRAAQVIKHDAEKRIRQAKRDLAATSSDKENIQCMLIQLLKEQELTEKLKTKNQAYRAPAPVSGLHSDLQYKLATLLQAYQPAPAQQLPAVYQRNWREQIATYNDMLQQYRQGNFYQSYQGAKRLLQLLLQKEATSAHIRLPPEFCPPHPQQQAVYQPSPNHVGNTSMQPLFRAPLAQPAAHPRRDPRLNRSSQQYQIQAHDITPRLNQSSYQYSEQDITPEIIYQADIAKKPSQVRRNSTPRKQSEEKSPSPDENAQLPMEEGQKQQSELRVKSSGNCDWQKYLKIPTETQEKRAEGYDSTEAYTSDINEKLDVKCKEPDRSGPKGHLHDWEQLQQRSQHHRQGRRCRHPSENAMPNDQPTQIGGKETGVKASRTTLKSKEEKHVPSGANPCENLEETRTDLLSENKEMRSVYKAETRQNYLGAEVASEMCIGTQSNVPQNSDKKTDHRRETASKVDNFQTEARTVRSDQNHTDETEMGTSAEVKITKHNAKHNQHETQDGQSRDLSDETNLSNEGHGNDDSFTNSQIKNRLETDLSLSTRADIQEATKKEMHDNAKVMDRGKERRDETHGKETTKPGQGSLLNGPKSHAAVAEQLSDSGTSATGKRMSSVEGKQQVVKETKTQSSQVPHKSQQSFSELSRPPSESLKETRQSADEARQLRNKQQPSPQIPAHTSTRVQPSRNPQPPFRDQNRRASRSQPSPRTLRQASQDFQQPSANIYPVSTSRPRSRNSQQLPQTQQSQTGTKCASAEGKSAECNDPKSRSEENITAKSGEAKSLGNASSKGKRSPGNTYVIRNSGQRLTSKPPSGFPREKPGGTRSPGANSSHLKSPSPRSSASKSPDAANKTQVSPPSTIPRRRRLRRKPWDRNVDETDFYKEKPGAETAPRGQSRFQDRNRDRGQQRSWPSSSPRRRTEPRYDNWDPQPRRRPYQWDDSKTGPAKKWRVMGQQGGPLPTKVSPRGEQQSRLESQKEKLGVASEPHKAAFETEQNTSGIDLRTNLERRTDLRENAVMTEDSKIVVSGEENVHPGCNRETVADTNVCTTRSQKSMDSENVNHGAISNVLSRDNLQRRQSGTEEKVGRQTKQNHEYKESRDSTRSTDTVQQESAVEDKTQGTPHQTNQTPHHRQSKEEQNQTELTKNRVEAGDHVRKKKSMQTGRQARDGKDDNNENSVGKSPESKQGIDLGVKTASDSLGTGSEESTDSQTGLLTSKMQQTDQQDGRCGQPETGPQAVDKDTPETDTVSPSAQEEMPETMPQTGKEVAPEAGHQAGTEVAPEVGHQAGEEESQRLQAESQAVKVEKPETFLEHVLAVLGKKAALEAEEMQAKETEEARTSSQTLHSTTSEHFCEIRVPLENSANKPSVTSSTFGDEASQEQLLHNEVRSMTGSVTEELDNETKACGEAPEVKSPSSLSEVPQNDTVRENMPDENSSAAFSCPSAKILLLEEMEDWESLGVSGGAGKIDVCQSEPRQQPLPLSYHRHQGKVKEKQEIAVPQNTSENQQEIAVLQNSSENQQEIDVPQNSSQNQQETSVPQNATENQQEISVPRNSSENQPEIAMPQNFSENRHTVSTDNSARNLDETTGKQETPGEISQCPYQREQETFAIDYSRRFEKTEDKQEDMVESLEHIHGSEENPMSTITRENVQGRIEETEKPCEMSEHKSFTEQDQRSTTTDHLIRLAEDSRETMEKLGLDPHKPKKKPKKLTSEDKNDIDLCKPGQAKETQATDMNWPDVTGSESQLETPCISGTHTRHIPLKTNNVNFQNISKIRKNESISENGQEEKAGASPERVEGVKHYEQSQPNEQMTISDEERLPAYVDVEQSPESCLLNDQKATGVHENEVCQLEKDNEPTLGVGPVNPVSPHGDDDNMVVVHADGYHETNETKEMDRTHHEPEMNKFENITKDDMQTRGSGSRAKYINLGKTVFDRRMWNTEATEDNNTQTSNKCVIKEESDLGSSEISLQNSTYPTVTESCSDQNVAVVSLSTMVERVANEAYSIKPFPRGSYGTESAGHEDFPENHKAKSTHNSPAVSQKDKSTGLPEGLATNITDCHENDVSERETARIVGIEITFGISGMTDKAETPISSSKKKNVSFADPIDDHQKSTAISSRDTRKDDAAGYPETGQVAKPKLESPPAEVVPALWGDLVREKRQTSRMPTTAAVYPNCGRRRPYGVQNNSVATGEVLVDKLTAFGHF